MERCIGRRALSLGYVRTMLVHLSSIRMCPVVRHGGGGRGAAGFARRRARGAAATHPRPTIEALREVHRARGPLILSGVRFRRTKVQDGDNWSCGCGLMLVVRISLPHFRRCRRGTCRSRPVNVADGGGPFHTTERTSEPYPGRAESLDELMYRSVERTVYPASVAVVKAASL
jgi:hypothetical protein